MACSEGYSSLAKYQTNIGVYLWLTGFVSWPDKERTWLLLYLFIFSAEQKKEKLVAWTLSSPLIDCRQTIVETTAIGAGL